MTIQITDEQWEDQLNHQKEIMWLEMDEQGMDYDMDTLVARVECHFDGQYGEGKWIYGESYQFLYQGQRFETARDVWDFAKANAEWHG